MNRRTTLISAGVLALVIAGAGVGVATAAGGERADQPITGDALATATAAALAHTGGGTVTETEAGDEEGAYGVEVTRQDGTKVDVHLNPDFRVLSTATDNDSPGDGDRTGR